MAKNNRYSFSLTVKRNLQHRTYNLQHRTLFRLFSESLATFLPQKKKKFHKKVQSFSLTVNRNLKHTTYNL